MILFEPHCDEHTDDDDATAFIIHINLIKTKKQQPTKQVFFVAFATYIQLFKISFFSFFFPLYSF